MFNLDEIIDYAKSEETKLNEKALSIDGMSSRNIRNLLNKVLSYPNVRYLEIGTWKGSTLYSALYGNNPEYALAIDNFCEFGGPRLEFYKNMQDINVPFDFIDGHCFMVDKSKIDKKFNVYFYDGGHHEIEQELSLTYFYDVLDDTFLYICDDYNWTQVQIGMRKGIEKAKLKIIDERELFSAGNGDASSWWNGIWIGVLSK